MSAIRHHSQIPVNGPYEWFSNLLAVPKESGDVRVTIDLIELNKVNRR